MAKTVFVKRASDCRLLCRTIQFDSGFVGSQPAAASARRKLQKVNSRIPVSVAL
jgi:hypothetical protein